MLYQRLIESALTVCVWGCFAGMDEWKAGLEGVARIGGGFKRTGGFICRGSLRGCDEYDFCKALGLFSIRMMVVFVCSECEDSVNLERRLL